MEALATVFEYIKNILKLIQDFFADIFPQKEETEGEEAGE